MLIGLSLLVPLLAAAAAVFAGLLPASTAHRARRGIGILAPLSVLPAVALAVSTSPVDLQAAADASGSEGGFEDPTGPGEVAAGGQATLELPWLLLGSEFVLDEVARPLLLIAALLYGAALMAISWMKLLPQNSAFKVPRQQAKEPEAEHRPGALSAFLMICFAGNIGVYLAADVVSFYLAFTLMSFAAVGLVIHYRTDSARRAARIYLVMSVISEMALLSAVLLVAAAGGQLVVDAPSAVADSELTGLIVALLLIGFGIKAGTAPLHVWLPLAHPAAPPAASAVLSGAMVKAGLVGWLRFLPDGEAGGHTAAGWVLLAFALAGAFAAVIFGVLQEDPKVVLAYSTISQMGFIAAVVAVGLLEPGLAPVAASAAVLYAVHHGLAKGALFLGVPVVKHYARGPAGVVVLIGMAGAGLAVAGAPLTSGAFGKYVSKEAVEGISVLGMGLDHILPLVATGSTLLLMRFGYVMWNSRPGPHEQPRMDGQFISWVLVCVAGIGVPWWIGAEWMPLGLPSWEFSTVWDATWPILLGLGLGGLVWVLGDRRVLPGWVVRADGTAVQPGDLVVAEESVALRGAQRVRHDLRVVHAHTEAAARKWSQAWSRAAEIGRRLVAGAESRLAVWESSGLAIVILLTTAVVLSLLGARWLL